MIYTTHARCFAALCLTFWPTFSAFYPSRCAASGVGKPGLLRIFDDWLLPVYAIFVVGCFSYCAPAGAAFGPAAPGYSPGAGRRGLGAACPRPATCGPGRGCLGRLRAVIVAADLGRHYDHRGRSYPGNGPAGSWFSGFWCYQPDAAIRFCRFSDRHGKRRAGAGRGC